MSDIQIKQRTITDHNLQEIRQHGTKEFPLGIYLDDLSTFEQGKIPWHWHEEIQFDIVIEGCIQFQIGSKGYILSEGQAIFINSGVLHQIIPKEETKGQVVAYVLRSSLLETDVLSSIYQQCLLPILKGPIECILFQESSDKTVINYLRQIQELYQTEEIGSQIEIKGLFCCLWNDLLKKGQQGNWIETVREQRDMDRIKTAITFIQEYYGEALSLERIAEQLALSKSELCRCFRRVMEITPYEYLIQYRIQEASKQLRQTNKKILDIALLCGFDSLGHMGRYFRRYCGCSPSEFRKRWGNMIH